MQGCDQGGHMDHDTEGVLANINQATLSREGIKLVGAIELSQHYETQPSGAGGSCGDPNVSAH